MKVTGLPEQMICVPVVIAMETAGATIVETVIVMPVLVAVVTAAHGALLVRLTVTTSLFAKVFELNVLLLVPALMPFTCH